MLLENERELLSLVVRGRANAYDELSAKLKEQFAAQTARVNANADRIRSRTADFTKVAADVATGDSDYADLFTSAEGARTDLAAVLKECVECWQNRATLYVEALEEFEPRLTAAQHAHAKVREDVRKKLVEIGMVGRNDDDFNQMVDWRNVHVREAYDAVSNAATLIQAATEQIKVSRDGVGDAHEMAVRVARKMAGLPDVSKPKTVETPPERAFVTPGGAVVHLATAAVADDDFDDSDE